MIQGAENSYVAFKALGGFVTKYATSQPTEDHRINPLPRKIFHKNKKTTLLLTM